MRGGRTKRLHTDSFSRNEDHDTCSGNPSFVDPDTETGLRSVTYSSWSFDEESPLIPNYFVFRTRPSRYKDHFSTHPITKKNNQKEEFLCLVL